MSQWNWKPTTLGHRWDDRKWFKRIKVGTGENGSGSIDTEDTMALAVAIVDASGTQITSFGGAASGGLTDTQLRATPVPVSGTVTATTGGLTDTQLRASPVPTSLTSTTVTGTVAVTDNSGSLTVDSTQLPAALGSGTTAQSLKVALATDQVAVPINDNSGSITVDAPVATPAFVRLSDGAAAISTLPVSGPLTDTQLRATPVPVSGSVTATTGGLTDTQLRATPVPVSLTSTTVTGTVAVTDNSGTLTVDAPVATPVFTRLSDGAAALVGQKAMTLSLPVTIASDQTAVPVSGTVTATTGGLTDTQLRATAVAISDNSGSLTVDAAVDAPVFVELSDGTDALSLRTRGNSLSVADETMQALMRGLLLRLDLLNGAIDKRYSPPDDLSY